MMTNITKEDLEKKLQSGLSVKEIAEQYDCGEMTIYRKIKKYNIQQDKPLYQNKDWLQEELKNKDILEIAIEQKVAEHTISRWMKKFKLEKPSPLYQNKDWLLKQTHNFNSVKELCDEYGLVEYTVKSWCRKFNIYFNNGAVKNYDEEYFKIIDSENKAYYLGLLMADGFMHKDIYSFGIGLKTEDRYMIESMLNDIGYKTELELKISEFGKEAWYATICSKKMCADLIYLGIVPKKSGKEIFPEYAIPSELKRHFIRGFIDGDGWITNNVSGDRYYSLEVGMCSMSINILYSIKILLEEELGIEMHITKRSDKELFDLKAFTKNAKVLLDYLYINSNIFLKRKKVKYDNVQLGPVNKNV